MTKEKREEIFEFIWTVIKCSAIYNVGMISLYILLIILGMPGR